MIKNNISHFNVTVYWSKIFCQNNNYRIHTIRKIHFIHLYIYKYIFIYKFIDMKHKSCKLRFT